MTTRPLSLALITGQHAFDVPGLYALFRAMPGIDFYPQALEDWAADFGEMRDRYDVLVFYNYHQTLDAPGGRTWGRDVRRAVERLGETPQGIVLLHHGIGAFQGWDAWDALCGMSDRRFEYFKGEQVRVHVADPTHQITEGVTDWEIVDEVYTLPEVGGDATVLLTTDHPRSTPTLAWTRQHRAGAGLLLSVRPRSPRVRGSRLQNGSGAGHPVGGRRPHDLAFKRVNVPTFKRSIETRRFPCASECLPSSFRSCHSRRPWTRSRRSAPPRSRSAPAAIAAPIIVPSMISWRALRSARRT